MSMWRRGWPIVIAFLGACDLGYYHHGTSNDAGEPDASDPSRHVRRRRRVRDR